jgi:5'-nucleotidase
LRILVTNDDGIDSVGLHVLARAMRPHGEVIVVAPDREFSGSGASIGSLLEMTPEVHTAHVDGIDTVWTVSGPPALCVMFAGLRAFGDKPDLVVSGINPGNNVGRSIYHSGTVGACTTARNSGVTGLAVSQSVTGWGVEGQGWDEMLANQKWETAAEIASVVVDGLVTDPPVEPLVINLNVPNTEMDEVLGWRRTPVAFKPPRSMSTVTLEPKQGHDGSYRVKMEWGEPTEVPGDHDSNTVMAGFVSITSLSRMAESDDDLSSAEARLEKLLS